MRGLLLLILAALLPAGCALSYRRCHVSPLSEVLVEDAARQGRAARAGAPLFEDAIISMADEFGVPLHQVIPVQIYVDGDDGADRSYYNRLTGSIVLKGPPDPAVFVHELSHLFSHRVAGTPAYWSDQGLAEYMEERFWPRGAAPAGPRSDQAASLEPLPHPGSASGRTRRLIERIAEARDPSEVLAHLTPRAVDEERGWGILVVRYLFDARWSDRSMPARIRALFRLTNDEVAALAPEVLEYCRRPELFAGGRPGLGG